jgi:nitrogen PTS system EIIA component
MDIKDFLLPADVLADVRVSDKSRLLQDLSKRAAAALELSATLVAEQIGKREELGSTGVGGGVAIPHARIEDVKKPFGILARLKKAIAFDAIDGQPVDIVFLLLLPTAPEGDALNALAAVSRRLRNGRTATDIRRASDAGKLYRVVALESGTMAG